MPGPGVFGLPHLSEDAVAAFADGVLSASAAERARRHCAECAECAAAVRGQREAVMLLRSAQTPSLPAGLMARLKGLPMSTDLSEHGRGLTTGIGPDGKPVLLTGQQPGKRAPDDRTGGGEDKQDTTMDRAAFRTTGSALSVRGARLARRTL